MKKIAIYPGTFDPITKGHLDVLSRAAALFDEVVICVADNSSKNPVFSQAQRIELIRPNIAHLENVRLEGFNELTVAFARRLGARTVIRGLRAVSDFEYEFQMAHMNRYLDAGVETIFLMPSEEFFYISSRLVKQVARFEQERLGQFVPQNVLEALRNA